MPRVASGEFVVGVETEAPLQVWSMKKTKQKDNRGRHIMERDRLLAGNEALAEVARQFNNAGLRAYADAVDANRDHSKWGITIDSSIEVGTELQGWSCSFQSENLAIAVVDPLHIGVGSPIEIKSPPLGLVSSHYKQIIETMWKIIGPMKVEIIQAWLMSNTQFHFSVKGCHNFPQGPAQKLGMCIIFFEKAIDDMIPSNPYKGDGRRPGGWKHCDRYTKRNRVVPDPEQGLPVDDLRSCWHYIRKTKNIRALSTLICFDEDKYRRDNDFEIKNWKWNFKGLGYKTIEFRHSKSLQCFPLTR
jgi:hypothetical protein